MKERLVLVTVFVFLIGCGSGSSGGSQSQQATPINVAGEWQITAKSTVFGTTATVTGLVNQSGGNLSGQLAISGSPCATSASMSGTISGAAMTVQINESGQTVTLTGTAAANGNSASGTYSAPAGGCTNGDSGTWSGNRLPQLSNISLNPATVTGGASSTGNVTLTEPALSAGAIITLSSDDPSAASVPASVTVAAGSTTAMFAITTRAVGATVSVIISATDNATQTAMLTVNPPVLSSVSLDPTTVLAGVLSFGTVTLNGVAPGGGAVVTLSSSAASVAAVPQSVTVPSGSLTATFQVTTSGSASTTVVTIMGHFGVAQSASISVNANSTPSTSLTGNWQASFTSSGALANSGAFYGYFSQSGNSTEANLHVQGAAYSSCYSNVSAPGVVSGLAVQFVAVNGSQVVTFTGTATANGNGMQGTYAVSGGCTNGDTGTWTATRVPTGECAPAPVGLLSWWRGEGSAADATGANPGTTEGATTFASGVVGQAFSLDGSTAYVNVPDSASLDSIKTAETVELWINPATPNGTEYIYSRRQPLVAESFSIFIQADGTLGVLIATTTSPTSSGSKFQSADGTIVFGQFQHIAVAADTTTGIVTAYLNGIEVPLTNTLGPATLTGTFAAVNQLYLGRREDLSVGEGVSGAGYTEGLLGEVSLYANALDQAQVQFIFHQGTGGKCPTVQSTSLSGPSKLDQSFTTLSNAGSLSADIDEAVTYVAQTFTASISGYLTGVNVDVESQPTASTQPSPFPISVSILATSNGVPTSTILASAVVGPGNLGLGSLITFEQPPEVVAGTQYAIAVNYVGAPPPGPSQGQGFWIGALGAGYSSGSSFSSVDGTHWTPLGVGDDVFFQTYVAP